MDSVFPMLENWVENNSRTYSMIDFTRSIFSVLLSLPSCLLEGIVGVMMHIFSCGMMMDDAADEMKEMLL